MEDFGDFEQTLFVCRECFVYKIPPRKTAEGYKCTEWGLSSPTWTGRMKVLSAGLKCRIVLEDPNTGDLFAECPVDDEPQVAVESVLDSSRYFVLRLKDPQGRSAFIGCGFRERSEAFDFNVALQDHQKQLAFDKKQKEAPPADEGPAKDYSLGDGQTIKINIKSLKKKDKKPDSGSSSSAGGGGGLGILLPPPPQ